MEEGFVVCQICSGIMREASVWEGEITCLVCSESQDLNPVRIVHNAVNQLEVKCPILRDCTWNGKLSEAENHLDNCNSFKLQCVDCEVTIIRGEYDNHKVNTCILREIKCEYCFKQGKAKYQEIHNEVCNEYPISCPNNCGEKFPRSKLSQHKSKCKYEKISCPYTQYGCEAKSMLRRDLLAHKKEFYIEHTDMSLTRIKILEGENSHLKKELSEMAMEGKIMKQLDGVEWEIKYVYKLPNNDKLVGPIVYINNYKLRIFLIKDSIFYRNKLQFCLERLPGDFDRYLGRAYITQYRVIIINKQDITKSYLDNEIMDYELCIGKYSEKFDLSHYLYEDCITADNSLFLRFYFEVNSEKTMKELMSCNQDINRPIYLSLRRSDPFY